MGPETQAAAVAMPMDEERMMQGAASDGPQKGERLQSRPAMNDPISGFAFVAHLVGMCGLGVIGLNNFMNGLTATGQEIVETTTSKPTTMAPCTSTRHHRCPSPPMRDLDIDNESLLQG